MLQEVNSIDHFNSEGLFLKYEAIYLCLLLKSLPLNLFFILSKESLVLFKKSQEMLVSVCISEVEISPEVWM